MVERLSQFSWGVPFELLWVFLTLGTLAELNRQAVNQGCLGQVPQYSCLILYSRFGCLVFCGELGRFFTLAVSRSCARAMFFLLHTVLHEHSMQQMQICTQLKTCQGTTLAHPIRLVDWPKDVKSLLLLLLLAEGCKTLSLSLRNAKDQQQEERNPMVSPAVEPASISLPECVREMHWSVLQLSLRQSHFLDAPLLLVELSYKKSPLN